MHVIHFILCYFLKSTIFQNSYFLDIITQKKINLHVFWCQKLEQYLLKELRNYKRRLLSCRANILNCCFSQQIYTLSHQTKYLHIENQISLTQVVFI